MTLFITTKLKGLPSGDINARAVKGRTTSNKLKTRRCVVVVVPCASCDVEASKTGGRTTPRVLRLQGKQLEGGGGGGESSTGR